MWQYPVKVIVRRPSAALPAAVILAVRRSPHNGCDGRRTMNPAPVLHGKKDAGADTFSLSGSRKMMAGTDRFSLYGGRKTKAGPDRFSLYGGRKTKAGPPHDAMALIHYRRIIIILV